MNRRTALSSAGATGLGWFLLSTTGQSARAAVLNTADASAGLKAALERGAQVAVAQLGAADGFLGNDKVRIGLPDVLEKAAPILRTIGQNKRLDELVNAMNHAAEEAVSLAKPLLLQAIKGMSVQDAQSILKGGDTAVTDYFVGKTRAPLAQQFQPVVNKAIDKVALVDKYNELVGKAAKLSLLRGDAVTVQQHVTQKALDGLYFVIGEEERRIRRDPVGTGSALLKKVFGV